MTVSPPRDGEPPVEEPQSVQPTNRPPCPRCGTPHEPNQEYCLECGLRLPVEANGLVPRLGRAWRRQLGWYPGDWVWPSLLALLIAALAGIGAAAFVSQDQKRADYVTGTSPFGAPPSTIPPPPRAHRDDAHGPADANRHRNPRPRTDPCAGPGSERVARGQERLDRRARLPAHRERARIRARAGARRRAQRPPGRRDHRLLEVRKPPPGLLRALQRRPYLARRRKHRAATTAQSHGYRRAYPTRITP